MITITQAEILDALAAAAKGDEPTEARTAGELAQETGVYIIRVRNALREYQRQGRLGVHKVSRVDLAGRTQKVTAYTITPLRRASSRTVARRHG